MNKPSTQTLLLAVVVGIVVVAFALGRPVIEQREQTIEEFAIGFVSGFTSDDAPDFFSKSATESDDFLEDLATAQKCIRPLGQLNTASSANFSHSSKSEESELASNVFIVDATYSQGDAAFKLEYVLVDGIQKVQSAAVRVNCIESDGKINVGT